MLTYTDFVNFLEDGNGYRSEIFSVYSTFNKLSNGISFVFVAENFIICTCLRMTSVVYKQAYDISQGGSHHTPHPTPRPIPHP